MSRFHSYQVIVGNIGQVYNGTDGQEAWNTFDEYVSQSISGKGRAGCESVTMMKDGDIDTEYIPDEIPV